jgi:subtilisin-like proprotein convertase family protein
MNAGKLSRIGGAALATALVALVALAPAAPAKKVSKTYTRGVGSTSGGVALPIPDGAGQNTQLVRSPIAVKGLDPRGKIFDVNVGVRADHIAARDLEFYLATPRGVINLSSDNGGAGNNYGGGFDSCAGQFTLFDSDNPTLISTPTLPAPFAGAFAPEESLNLLDGLGNKKANNATWSLLVEDDDAANPAGTLFCWKITIGATSPKKKAKKKK